MSYAASIRPPIVRASIIFSSSIVPLGVAPSYAFRYCAITSEGTGVGIVPPQAAEGLTFLGELGLDGAIRGVRGALSVARRLAGRDEVRGLVLPPANVNEAGSSGWAFDLAVSGNYVYVANMSDGTVSQIDRASGRTVATIAVADPKVLRAQGCAPDSVHAYYSGSWGWRACDTPYAIGWDGNSLWALDNGNRQLVRVDPLRTGGTVEKGGYADIDDLELSGPGGCKE